MAETLIPVFDLGGVFIDWDPMLLFRKIFETEEEAVWFSKTVCTPDWNLEFDAGMPYREGIVALMAKFPQYWREIDAFDTRWDEMFGPFHQGTIDIHNELIDADLPTFAITNFAWEKWQTVLPKWDFLEKFDGVVVSGIEKLVKPDTRIYRVFVDRYGLDPEDCVFIDDNIHNVVAAQKFGMQAVHFTNPKKLREDLRALGLPLAP